MRNQIVQGICSAILLVVLTGCLGEETTQAAGPARPALAVKTIVVEPVDVPLSYEYPAKVHSVQQVDVVARVSGILEAKHFSEGQVVQKGDLLYEIDPAKYQATYNQAVASLGVEEAALKAALRDWERTDALYGANAISQQVYDNALKTYETAKASVAAAKATRDLAKIDLDYTKIYAPSSGMIGLASLDEGSYIASSSTPLVTITQVNPVHVEFSLPDRDFLKHKEEFKDADVRLLLGGKVLENAGEITFIDANINPLTSTVQTRATFKNGDSMLMPGLFARIRLEGLVAKNGITIPQSALMQDAGGSFVYVHKEGKVQKVSVVIEQPREGMFIIQSGLQGGEELILNNLTKLRPNAPVRVENP
ncbi:MAG: efflux RND transporter periplasmic adaptor subunit [Campylobacterales bacterium]|nr:efflux RND transporter periplasmic adaptor subunit [Campylobacterales bacterium]